MMRGPCPCGRPHPHSALRGAVYLSGDYAVPTDGPLTLAELVGITVDLAIGIALAAIGWCIGLVIF